MKKNLFSILCLFLLIHTANAQYTGVINSNRPGRTESPYVVGNDVLQFENTFYYKYLHLEKLDFSSFNHNFNVRYGFFNEKLEAIINRHYTSERRLFSDEHRKGTDRLSIGAKYMVFHKKQNNSEEAYKSWKKRYGFWSNGIFPTVALAAHVNSPLTNKNFENSGTTTFSFNLITQNTINKRFRLNNQFDYNEFGGDLPEFVFTSSATYISKENVSPYIEIAYHNNKEYSFFNAGFGISYLYGSNFVFSGYLDTTIGSDIYGLEVGINASYRFDWHQDVWIYKKQELDEDLKKKKKEFEEDADDEDITTESSGKKRSIFGNFFKRKEKTKKEKKEEKEETLNDIFNFPTEKTEKAEEKSDTSVDSKKAKKKEKEKKNNSFIEGY